MGGFGFIFPTLADELASRLSAALSLLPEEVPCSLGYPAGGVRDEHVWVSGAVSAEHPFYATGLQTRGEKGRLRVHLIVTRSADEMSEPRDRVLELAALVEDVLAEDRTMDGLVDGVFVVASEGQEAIPDKGRRQYGLTLTLEYEGSVTAG